MRKEVVFAIIIGLILGLVILFGWELANQAAKQAASTSTPSTANPPLAETPTPAAQSITITSPQNHAVVNTGSIKIVAKTQPNASIAISDTEDDAIVTADKEGNFSANLKLTGGANVIKLTVLKDDLSTDSIQITVIYTTAKIDSPAALMQTSDTPVASAEAIKDDINKRIQEALDKNLKNTQNVLSDSVNRSLLVGYAGTISDIKQGVFNLTTDETNLQVSYDTKTTILKDGKLLKPELLSVKDKTLVIGNLTSPDILVAKRIVITSKDDGPIIEKKVIFSAIVKIKGNIITLNIDNKNQDIVLGNKLKLDLKTLTTNNKIFGIIIGSVEPTGPVTLLQAKII